MILFFFLEGGAKVQAVPTADGDSGFIIWCLNYEEDCFGGKMEGSRLKYVDHHLRQQRALPLLTLQLLMRVSTCKTQRGSLHNWKVSNVVAICYHSLFLSPPQFLLSPLLLYGGVVNNCSVKKEEITLHRTIWALR